MRPTMTTTSALRVSAEALRTFEPLRLGSHAPEFFALLERLVGKRQSEIVLLLEDEAEKLRPDDRRDIEATSYWVTILVLRDYILAGNYPLQSHGRLFLANVLDSTRVSEANYHALLRRQYEAARNRALRDRGKLTWLKTSLEDLRKSGYSAHEVVAHLQHGPPDLDLLDAKATTRAEGDPRSLWRLVRATWSMTPEASAPGRELAFVAVDRRSPATPLGIIQIRNVVPEINQRDLWLGIAVGEARHGFLGLLGCGTESVRRLVATREVLSALLASVQSEGIPVRFTEENVNALGNVVVVHRRLFNETREPGRDTALKNEHLRTVKRAQTAQDLLRGITALNRAIADLDSLNDSMVRKDLDAGLTKLWHYHMGFVALELSICGASPPFGPLRVGKLMAALAGSQPVLDAWGADRPLGQIAQEVYDPEVRARVPNLGPLIVFTSGLYPGHSAQYERVDVGTTRWRKIGETTGYGSFHISVETTEAMRRLNELVDGYTHITRSFGEGSGARFRTVGRALSYLGLPDLRRHETKRPLYALPLVPNAREALFGWEEQRREAAPSLSRTAESWWHRWVSPRAVELVVRAKNSPDLTEVLGEVVSPQREHRYGIGGSLRADEGQV
jgi:hypothetical protein